MGYDNKKGHLTDSSHFSHKVNTNFFYTQTIKIENRGAFLEELIMENMNNNMNDNLNNINDNNDQDNKKDKKKMSFKKGAGIALRCSGRRPCI